jgi:murein DD-endopeptidase MepM/ murein hydrolase activator NlpD
MVPYWVWTALPRFFPTTEADKHLADAEPHEQKPPPKPAPVITGGEWADVPPAAPPWADLPGAAPKPTGLAAFADPGSGLYWPVRAPKGHFGRAVCYIGADGKGYGPKGSGSCGRNFLANRPAGDPNPNRFHVGIDLFADFHDIIVACESGTIIQWKYFYTNVWKLMVACDSGLVINYGEVDGSSLKKFNLQPGGRVVAGQPIAVAGKMLHDSMLHFEMYPKGTPDSISYNKGLGEKHLKNYLNPTQYLLNLAKSGK